MPGSALLSLLLAAHLAGCKEPTPAGDTGSLFDDDVGFGIDDGDLLDVSGVVSGVIPTVVRIRWASPVEGVGYVEYGEDGDLTAVTPDDAGGTDHDVLVLGLKAGRHYSFRAVTRAADGSTTSSGVGTVALEPPPQSLGRFELTTAESGARSGGYVLTSLLQAADSWMVILDREGDIVWYYPATDGFSIPTTKPARDGQSLLFTQNGSEQDEDVSNIQRITIDGSSSTTTRALLGHHSFVELPDKRFAWISLDFRTVDVDGTAEYLAGDTILEIDEGATDADTPTEVFNYFDDWQDPYRMCEHFDADAYGTGAKDWTHANSLMYVDAQDDLYIMSKNNDHILRVDHATGQVVWQIGGPESDFTSTDPDAWWSHGHMSDLWDGGFVVFDNGYHHTPTHSGVKYFTWDETGMTVTPQLQYWDPANRFVQLLGDGRLLDNGNVLASWTSAGIINELDPTGTVVWQVESTLGTATGRVTMLDSLYTLERGEAN